MPGKKKLKVEIEVFFRGNVLISYLQNHPETDILFLDIRLPDRDGVEIGSCIRDVLDNQKLILVYISALEQYAMQLFRNRPFDFLLKPLEAGEIERLMDRILRVTGKGKTCFAYQTRSGVSRVPYREILYFQSLGRKIQIMTEKGPRFFYGKLGELAGSLPEDQFLVIHKSFIVNFTFVREYTQSQVHLTNGDTLPISKSRQSQVRRKIMERERNV